jgi:hypothetical protein
MTGIHGDKSRLQTIIIHKQGQEQRTPSSSSSSSSYWLSFLYFSDQGALNMQPGKPWN